MSYQGCDLIHYMQIGARVMKHLEQESSTVEFKQEVPANHQICKSIIGFCNQHGGKLVLGVADDGTIVGIPEGEINELMTKVGQTIYDSCHPPILPFVYSQRIQDKVIVIIEVSAGLYKPYFLKSKGMAKGTYVRLGPSTVIANAEMIQELQMQAQGHVADQSAIYTASVDDLDIEAVNTLFDNNVKGKQEKEASYEILKGYGLLIEEHKQWYPTVAGILLFAKQPQQFISESFIICSHFSGVDGREVIATRDCEGTLFQQFTDAYTWVLGRINRSFTIKGAKRDEQYEIPEVAIREVIINAIVHRSYQYKSPSKIAIYDDRIEIFSPGNFPGPLRTDQLEYGFTYMRNPTICKLFRKKGLMEKLGSGFTILFESYRKHKLLEPMVVEGTGYVKCILPRRGTQLEKGAAVESREAKILRLLTRATEIETNDVEKLLGVSKPTAVRALSKMVSEGLIERIGKGPATRYRMKKN